MYAFWKYDRYPYLLGEEIEKIESTGMVYIKSYCSWFNPVFELQNEEGKIVKLMLTLLENKKHEAERKIDDDFMKKRDDVLSLFGVNA
jgi:hypothetical protein